MPVNPTASQLLLGSRYFRAALRSLPTLVHPSAAQSQVSESVLFGGSAV